METARGKAFVAAVETGSFSRAAERLGYTTSGVSQLVSALEQELGFPLLIRGSRGVTLTDNGCGYFLLFGLFCWRRDGCSRRRQTSAVWWWAV